MRASRHRATVAAHQMWPQQWIPDEVHGGESDIQGVPHDRGQNATNEAQIVVLRQPQHVHGLRAEAGEVRRSLRNVVVGKPAVRNQVRVCDHDAFGVPSRTRCILKKCQARRIQLPSRGAVQATQIAGHLPCDVRPSLPNHGGAGPVIHRAGEGKLGSAVPLNVGETLDFANLARHWWIDRNRHNACLQTSKECINKVQP
mmetsp:Transcript_32333/g.77314  ORF Transcript_32333/g.77314 Transcript_32333/m.77314 type:complete len:200 (-) Transcript_32333:595-1194(-)